MVHAGSGSASRARLARITRITRLPRAFLGPAHLTAETIGEETEVLYLIAETYHPVTTQRLVELHTGHRETEHTGGAVLNLCREVVMEGGIDTQQG